MFQKKAIFFFIIISLVGQLFAQNKFDSTLLWRISGNGLKHSSYLYGTMHIKKKQAFLLGDSVYAAIEQTKFLGLEVIPPDGNEYCKTEALLRASKSKMPDSFITFEKTTNHKLIKKYTLAYLQKVRKSNAVLFNNEQMPVILDAYLYHYAKQLGKETGSIEHHGDIKSYFKNIEELADNDSDITKRVAISLANLEHVYLNQALTEMDLITKNFLLNYASDLSLVKRNYLMDQFIDSVHRTKPGFFAVGCAHLVTNEGLIKLLRKRGYSVTPVFSKAKIDKKFDFNKAVKYKEFTTRDGKLKYKAPYKFLPIAERNFEGVRNVASDLNLRMPFIIYENFGLDNPISDEDFTEHFKAIMTLDDDNTSILSSKIKFVNKNRVLEAYTKDDEGYWRFLFFKNGEHTYSVYALGETKEDLSLPAVNQFFNSIAVVTKPIPAKWTTYKDVENGIEFITPNAAVVMDRHEHESGVNVEYTATDLKNGNVYTVLSKSSSATYSFSNDSMMLVEASEVPENNTNMTKEIVRYIGADGFVGYELKVFENEKLILFKRLLRKNEHLLHINAYISSGDTSSLATYINSLKYTQPKMVSALQKCDEGNFEIFAPGKFAIDKNEDEANTESLSFVTVDTASSVTYYVTKYPIDSFRYFENKDAFFEYCKSYISENDTVGNLQYKIDYDATRLSVIFPRKNYINQYTQNDYVLANDTIYELSIQADKDYLNSANAKKFFNSFNTIYKQPSTVFESKYNAFLQYIEKYDTSKGDEYFYNVINYHFNKQDLQSAYNYAVFNDTSISLNYTSDPNSLFTVALCRQLDTTIIPFVYANMAKAKTEIQKIKLLQLLSACHTKVAIDAFVDVLPKMKLKRPISLFVRNDFYSYNNEASAYWYTKLPTIQRWMKDKYLYVNAVELLSLLTLDSLITKNDIALVKKELLSAIRIDKLMNDFVSTGFENGVDHYYMIVRLFEDKDCAEKFAEFGTIPDDFIQLCVFNILLDNKVKVPLFLIDSLAANYKSRADLYSSLQKTDQKNDFPKQYLNQKDLSKAFLYEYFSDNERNPSEMIFWAEEKIKIKGKIYVAYVYKVNLGYDDHPDWILAAAGGYSESSDVLEPLLSDELRFYADWDNDFTQFDTVDFLKAYIKFVRLSLEAETKEK